MSFIEINELIKVYNPDMENFVIALRGVNLKISQNDFVSIIGPSGCGKTTLLNLIALFDRPTAGSIAIEGVDNIFKLKEKDQVKFHQKTLGYVSQFSLNNLISSWSVEDNIKIPIKSLGQLTREQTKKRIKELLKLIDLESKLSSKVNYLSGGENQRVSFAVAIANNPMLLLADEPTGELDSVNTKSILGIINEIVTDYETTVITVTHDKIIANGSKSSWKMIDGRITDRL